MKKYLFPFLLLAFSFAELQPKELTRNEWWAREMRMIGKFITKYPYDCTKTAISTGILTWLLNKDIPNVITIVKLEQKGRNPLTRDESQKVILRTAGELVVLSGDVSQIFFKYFKFREKELVKTRSRFF